MTTDKSKAPERFRHSAQNPHKLVGHPEGEWVSFTDFAAMRTQNERLRLESKSERLVLRALKEKAEDERDAMQARAEKAEAENERLGAALSASVQFADWVADQTGIDMDETILTVRVMPVGREVGSKSWAEVQNDARAALERKEGGT